MTIKDFAEVCCSMVEIYQGTESSKPIFRGDIEDFEHQEAIIFELCAVEVMPSGRGSSDDDYAIIAIYCGEGEQNA